MIAHAALPAPSAPNRRGSGAGAVQKNYRVLRDESGAVRCFAVPAGDFFFAGYPVLPLGVHSPSGFEIGYGGSGPAELALAILADWTGEPLASARELRGRAGAHHQQFKWIFLAGQRLAPGDSLTIPGRAVADFLYEAENGCDSLCPAPPPDSAPVRGDLG